MKYSDLSALAIKIAGLVLLVLLLSGLPEHIELLKSTQSAYSPVSVFYVALPIAVVILASVMLILFPYKISNKLIINPDDAINLPPDNIIQVIGIRLIGFLLLFWAISDLVYYFFLYFIYRDMIEASFGAGTYDYAALLATVAELIFALFLLFRAKLISGYINAVGK